MILRFLIFAVLAVGMGACSPHSHEENTNNEQEEVKFQFTAYSNDFELFIEADAFVVSETANVLSHFSTLPDFRAVEEGKITIVLAVNGKETRQSLDKPTRKGIYSFDIRPDIPGTGSLRFEIVNSDGSFEVNIPEVTVFINHEEVNEVSKKNVVPGTNTTVFTKEQSWKVDFATGYPKTEAFGQAIKTTALVQAAPGNEMIITAKSAGIVLLPSNNLFEGKEINAGQSLLTISGSGLVDNNISVKYSEAKSNYEKANADYERIKELAKDKIVSEKDLLTVKNLYETTKAVFDNMNKNTGKLGQTITSPVSGYVKQVFVKHGSYVETGQTLLVVSQNNTLVLRAEVSQRYAHILGTIHTANIRNPNNNITYSLDQLNGRLLSFGKAANTDNFFIPVTFQIDNGGNFVPGSFVEVYLKTITNTQAVIIPLTAILEEMGNYFVWVQLTPELFEKRQVHTGGTDGLQVEITKGITDKERIVTRGAMLIKLAQATGALDAHSGHVH